MTHYHTTCVHCGDTHLLANHNEVPTYCCLATADSAAWDVSTYFLSEQMHEEEFGYSGWEYYAEEAEITNSLHANQGNLYLTH